MKRWTHTIGLAAAILIGTSGGAGSLLTASEPPAPKIEKPAKDLRKKIAEMPSKARLAMSSVVGWSPIYDIEEISLREKEVFRVTFDHQGHPAQVHIDEHGDVLDDPAVTRI